MTEATELRMLTFEPFPYYADFTNIIQLNDATPKLENLVFNINHISTTKAIQAYFTTNSEEKHLKINRVTFIGGKAISFIGNNSSTKLTVSHSEFKEYLPLGDGDYFYFYGINLDINNSKFNFYEFHDNIINAININLPNNSTTKTINLYHNEFISRSLPGISSRELKDDYDDFISIHVVSSSSKNIVISGSNRYNLNI